jgi:hypothetical protein
VDHPRFAQDRQDALAALDLHAIDAPIVDIVEGFSQLPYCFTLQSCVGHFVCAPGQDSRNLDPLPVGKTGRVEYRIAYLACCIENSSRGKALRDALARIPETDPAHIQFGSPEWFWESHVNSYALQVEPSRFNNQDKVTLEYQEALDVQATRDVFFAKVRELLEIQLSEYR